MDLIIKVFDVSSLHEYFIFRLAQLVSAMS